MKKIVICLHILIFLLPAVYSEEQREDPIYIHDIPNVLYVGPLVCEFATDGNVNMIRIVEPYIYNGKLFFAGLAFPVSPGNLGPNFEFNLDFLEDNPRILGMYNGSIRENITNEHVENGLFVAGYAQPGSIIIDHIFFDMESADRWANTVRLASD